MMATHVSHGAGSLSGGQVNWFVVLPTAAVDPVMHERQVASLREAGGRGRRVYRVPRLLAPALVIWLNTWENVRPWPSRWIRGLRR